MGREKLKKDRYRNEQLFHKILKTMRSGKKHRNKSKTIAEKCEGKELTQRMTEENQEMTLDE